MSTSLSLPSPPEADWLDPLYRKQRRRAIVDEYRTHQDEARSLSSLASEIAHLRSALEAVAATVRGHGKFAD